MQQSSVKYTQEYCQSLPRFDRSVSLLCWVYNEEDLVGPFLDRISDLLRQCVEDYEIVVVDDCSTDRTLEIVRRKMQEIPQIRLVRNPINMNVGYSCRKAIQSATKEYLFWQTIDWSYDISYLRAFLEQLKSYDVVAGVRREPIQRTRKLFKPILGLLKLVGIKHLTRRSDTVPKAIISVCNYILIRCLFNLPLSDYQNVVFYPTRLIQSFALEGRSSFLNPECLLKAYWGGATIFEVPINFLPRATGQAKGTRFRAILSSILDIFGLWFRWIILGRRQHTGGGRTIRYDPEQWSRFGPLRQMLRRRRERRAAGPEKAELPVNPGPSDGAGGPKA